MVKELAPSHTAVKGELWHSSADQSETRIQALTFISMPKALSHCLASQ